MNLLMTQMRRFLSSANPEQIIYDREKCEEQKLISFLFLLLILFYLLYKYSLFPPFFFDFSSSFQVIKIACWFSKLCLDDTQPRSYFLAIKILEIASEKLELPDAITPIHVELLKHYLLTKSYRRALRVANRSLFSLFYFQLKKTSFFPFVEMPSSSIHLSRSYLQ